MGIIPSVFDELRLIWFVSFVRYRWIELLKALAHSTRTSWKDCCTTPWTSPSTLTLRMGASRRYVFFSCF